MERFSDLQADDDKGQNPTSKSVHQPARLTQPGAASVLESFSALKPLSLHRRVRSIQIKCFRRLERGRRGDRGKRARGAVRAAGVGGAGRRRRCRRGRRGRGRSFLAQ